MPPVAMPPPSRLGPRALHLAVLSVTLAVVLAVVLAEHAAVLDDGVLELPAGGGLLRRGNFGGLPPLEDVAEDEAGPRVVVAVRSPARRRSSERLLSRKRRYIVFPRGSSIQMVAEFTVGSFVPFTTIFTTGVTWGIAWRLPTHSYELYLNKRAVGEDPDQQHRAELLDDLVVFLDKFGLHGEHCVRRTLCDLQTPRTRRAAKGGFMEEVLKALFTFSGSDSQSGGPDSNSTCEARFPHGVSILDVRPDMYTDK